MNSKTVFYILLLACFMLGVTSCVTTHVPPGQVKKTTVVKKSHPHGGPPGQTKKGPGHPGKKH